MNAVSVSPNSPNRMSATPRGREVRYERLFLRDLQQIPQPERQLIQQFVLADVDQVTHLQSLPDFRPIGNSGILYRFKLASHFICIELTGQIVKFLRVVPEPRL